MVSFMAYEIGEAGVCSLDFCGRGSSRFTPQYGQKLIFWPDPQLKATGIAIVLPSLAEHFGHRTSQLKPTIAHTNIVAPRIISGGNGRLPPIVAESGKSSHPPTATATHQRMRLLIRSRIVSFMARAAAYLSTQS